MEEETFGTPVVAADKRTNRQTDRHTDGNRRCLKPACGKDLTLCGHIKTAEQQQHNTAIR